MVFNVNSARLLACLTLLSHWSPVVWAQPCEDLDTQACALLEKSKPDLCQDNLLSQSACKRYCNFCPLQCYSCDSFNCNTTAACYPGEKCLTHTTISTIDGQKDILTKCSSPEECDGRLASVVIGRRQIGKRNMAVTCCSYDLCNDPAATTGSIRPTTGSQLHNANCPSDHIFDRLTSLCMKVMDTTQETFDHAQSMCQAIGDNLVIIDTHEKNVFIEDIIMHTSNEQVLMRGYWIGGRNHNDTVPKQFEWMNGTPFLYANWGSGDPDGNRNERCVVMLGPDMYKWSDTHCSNMFHYICERQIPLTAKQNDMSVSTTTAPPTTSQNTLSVCDTSGGFMLHEDGQTRLCIKLHSHYMDWSHARMTCTQQRSDLLVVDTNTKLTKVFNKTRGHKYWVGASVPNFTSDYTWVNGHLLTQGSSLWELGQPGEHQEACVLIEGTQPSLRGTTCTHTHLFVCERSLE
ncbi:macrophage mannose receptor 1-like isoform X2 [Mya arenaria]|uniref:macrophage mannose receptor 1-like isoform X2 n=1 Tax=Mya arenaria TaxID=6604 RepID=UPI0022E8C05A|nr:macrophage mannose receptor 1-like isoform X2 [Mya arenaria]